MSQSPNQQNQEQPKHEIRPRANGSRPDDVGSKAADIFDGIGNELWNRYIKPGVMGLLNQLWHGAGDYIFRTISGNNNGAPNPSGASYFYGNKRNNYGGYYNGGPQNNNQQQPSVKRSDRVRKVDTWSDAEDVRDELSMAMERYKCISVSDFNAATHVEDADYQDRNWGWYDISEMQFRPSIDGKIEIVMPRPERLRR